MAYQPAARTTPRQTQATAGPEILVSCGRGAGRAKLWFQSTTGFGFKRTHGDEARIKCSGELPDNDAMNARRRKSALRDSGRLGAPHHRPGPHAEEQGG